MFELSTLIYPSGNYKPTFGTTFTNPSNVIETPLSTFFQGKSIKGTWKLKVYDSCLLNTGTLNSWSIKFEEVSFNVL